MYGFSSLCGLLPVFVRSGRCVAAALALLIGFLPAAQAAWPERPVRVVVPFPPGGAIDSMIRIVAPHIESEVGKPVVIENRPGAGGVVGTLAALRAEDSHTFLMTAMGHVIAPSLYADASYDPVRDFAAVAPVGVVPNVLVVPADSSLRSVADLIETARARPGRVTFGSAGTGSSLHLTPALFGAMTGIELTHVPYRGSVAAMTDLVAGRIDLMFDSATSAAPQIAAGKIRALAVATSSRAQGLPDLPTIAESGVQEYGVDWWYALLAPRDVPPEGRERVGRGVARALADPQVRERFAAIYVEPMAGDASTLDATLRADHVRWAEVVKRLGIKAE